MKFSFRAVGHWSKGILTLRELREEDEGKGVEPDYGFENYANKETDTKYQRGSGEAHVKSMPSQPRYVLLNEDEEIDYKDIETRLANDSALDAKLQQKRSTHKCPEDHACTCSTVILPLPFPFLSLASFLCLL